MSDWYTILENRSKDSVDINYIPGVGVQGPKGDTGATGATGPQGPAGSDGAKGLQWQGTYSSIVTYTIDDAIYYNGSAYISLQANNLNHQPDISPSYWDLLASKGDTGDTGATGAAGADGADGNDGAQGPQGDPGINWLAGGWSNLITYNINDATTHNGTSYICILSHSNQEPPNGTYWEILAAKGDTGDTGSTGSTGATGPQGDPGEGVPSGGTTGQYLNKIDGTDYNTQWSTLDHGNLAGLADDDHTQYHNNTRGDARYYTQTQLDGGQLDSLYADISAGVPSTGADNTVLKRTGTGPTDWAFAKQEAIDVDTDTTNFNLTNGTLSASDTDVQTALESLDGFTNLMTASLGFETQYNPDRPPAGLHASSDEFIGGINGSWVWGNQDVATDTATLDCALLAAVDGDAHASDGLNCRFRTAPGSTTNFVVTTKVTPQNPINVSIPTIGLVLMRGTTGSPSELTTIAVCETATNGSSIKVDSHTSYNGTITAKAAVGNVVTSWGLIQTRPIYLQAIVVGATNEIWCYYSFDGFIWHTLTNFMLGGRPDYLGRFVDADYTSGTAGNCVPRGMYHWFRILDNTTSQACGS